MNNGYGVQYGQGQSAPQWQMPSRQNHPVYQQDSSSGTAKRSKWPWVAAVVLVLAAGAVAAWMLMGGGSVIGQGGSVVSIGTGGIGGSGADRNAVRGDGGIPICAAACGSDIYYTDYYYDETIVGDSEKSHISCTEGNISDSEAVYDNQDEFNESWVLGVTEKYVYIVDEFGEVVAVDRNSLHGEYVRGEDGYKLRHEELGYYSTTMYTVGEQLWYGSFYIDESTLTAYREQWVIDLMYDTDILDDDVNIEHVMALERIDLSEEIYDARVTEKYAYVAVRSEDMTEVLGQEHFMYALLRIDRTTGERLDLVPDLEAYVRSLAIYGDYIYYVSSGDILRTRLDGSGSPELVVREDHGSAGRYWKEIGYYIYNSQIYYNLKDRDGYVTVYRSDLNGNNTEKMDAPGCIFGVCNGMMFCLDTNGKSMDEMDLAQMSFVPLP
ncbi:MAG: hypothetical protein E7554_00670 [Ruminococcaceae bacterium]|nr:hypothetical protein [Oscillospiraceae bacterium]